MTNELNAGGAMISERIAQQAHAIARLHTNKFNPKMTAHMGYIQRIMGDLTGCLHLITVLLDESIKFTLAGCLVIEDNNMADSIIEFKDLDGKVLAKITNLCVQMPRTNYE